MHDDRLLPAEPALRSIARVLYEGTRTLPIVSPHGHCDAVSLAENSTIDDPAFELVTQDHYVLRLLYSQGIALEDLGVTPRDGAFKAPDARSVWRTFARHYHLFRGTPTRLWLDYTLNEVLGVETPLGPSTADQIYDEVCDRLHDAQFAPRSLYERFNIEFLATTDAATDPLEVHTCIRSCGWSGVVVPTFRPDDVVDPERSDFRGNLARLAELTDTDTSTWQGYLEAIRIRRSQFIAAGATASDHGHPTPATADLGPNDCDRLFRRVVTGVMEPQDAERFRAQMLTELAAMSVEDQLVMQLHVGSWRDHNAVLARRFGRDIGADIPTRVDFVSNLKPLLDRFGNEAGLTVVVYTLDETTYARELAPLAGHYPALRLGAPWWFFDSPQGIRRFYHSVVETAGFANLAGFSDDARSLLSIPARHDALRRMNAGYLAELVAEHQLSEGDAGAIAQDLAYAQARRTFRVER